MLHHLALHEAPLQPVEGADASPFPPAGLLRFQEIKLAGDGCSSNHRFLLLEDGSFFLQENLAADCAARPLGTRFNRPFPKGPTHVLNAGDLRAIDTALRAQGIADSPPPTAPRAGSSTVRCASSISGRTVVCTG